MACQTNTHTHTRQRETERERERGREKGREGERELCVCVYTTRTHTRKANLNRRGHSSQVFDLASGENTFYIKMREHIPYPHKGTNSIYHTRLVLDFAIGEQGADNGAWWASHHLFFGPQASDPNLRLCLSVSLRLCLSFISTPSCIYTHTCAHARTHSETRTCKP